MSQIVQVVRDNLTDAKLVDVAMPPLAQDAVRLKIESFSVTANNVTYAVVGDQMGYWNFFPGSDDRGVVPMWGHGVVEQSNHPDFAVGERVYGYLPMGTHLDVKPGKISDGSFTDMAAHRQPMSPIYNQYSRLAADPEHDPAKEPQRMIFGPLFKTGFLIETMFSGEKWFGAQVMVMTSASSKTSMALASVAKDKSPQIKRVGLTSPGNVEFVKASGLYDQVLSYDEVEKLAVVPTVSVDFAGNSAVLRAIHEHLGDNLAYSCLVGATHLDGRSGGAGGMPGPEPILFFAPHYAVAAVNAMGAKAFGQSIAESWRKFLHEVEETVEVEVRRGIDAARETFVTMVGGKVDPAVGIVIEP
ncbi:DUF2855 family protein [Altererythrobacter confluentis]|uniref:DUF2855 family protein n=1 Tax=Allopontixanthobacter confluentis TaxID=1849021 RepID=A0A6L7GHA1_9SPHN|nr:DUF2855 family protein [Allopontixanthobacter confluentis]MXP14328.1 DUF2855 family protein [Allopontixanthobacter confluentis]